ncbi:MAG: hypothetical protein AAB305_03075 [Candidatus Zixiibacteriota bacterium]
MTKRATPPLYETEKLTFAAYLITACQNELVSARPTGQNRKVVFQLSQVPTQDQLRTFFDGTAKVSALRYAEVINRLKGAAYEVLRCNGAS